jgi:hypothetical protein
MIGYTTSLLVSRLVIPLMVIEGASMHKVLSVFNFKMPKDVVPKVILYKSWIPVDADFRVEGDKIFCNPCIKSASTVYFSFKRFKLWLNCGAHRLYLEIKLSII